MIAKPLLDTLTEKLYEPIGFCPAAQTIKVSVEEVTLQITFPINTKLLLGFGSNPLPVIWIAFRESCYNRFSS